MLAAERHGAILERLAHQPAVRVSGLALALGVSEMTVRRDIDILEARGALVRVHGGAVRPGSLSSVEAAFDVNRT
ncbi:MAG: cytochrome, partial [Micrococcaceae bacterium]|nr:cytochrome [Micrococcaceae bacterium]